MEGKMQKDTTFRIIKQGIQLGIVAAVALFFIIALLLGANSNTLTAQTIAKFLVVGGAVFLGFGWLKKSMKDFHLFKGMLMALIIGITSAFVLTGFEIAMYNLANVKLAPISLLNIGISPEMLSILFSVEMMAWSIVGGLVSIQYYKKPHRLSESSSTG